MILFFLLANLAFSANLTLSDTPPKTSAPVAKPMRYRHIWDQDGKILATIDTKDGSIDYKENPKEVVKVLIGALDRLSNECQAVKEIPKPKK